MHTARVLDRLEGSEIAIIGMSGRFPGAKNIEQFWENVREGVESRETYTDEQLRAEGALPFLLHEPRYVKSGFPLDDVEMFDAEFFGVNPREASTIDPQHRLMLECAWQALENAGYDADQFDGAIGIFAGATNSSYLTANLLSNLDLISKVGYRQIIYGSVPDYMVTRTSYKLNLKGPSCFVQTACSTSLVAVHLGCQSLANHESDMILAGGVSVTLPNRAGYLYEEGGMESPDGIVRPFDSRARGTVFGNGVAVVVLKRIADAVADRDFIHAVIKGTATNNDGAMKVGFTAPSVEGQARVVAEALANSGVSAESIQYLEAHGTGTALGDPIEIAALNRAYRAHTGNRSYCAIGSVKPNVGHLDAAAGVASLIKAVMAMKHRQLPPLINFEKANPKIQLEDSPFYINTALRDWPDGAGPRRSGVSAFGFGGTNAHVILEEAPELERSGPSRPWQLLSVSARTPSALEAASQRLSEYLGKPTAANLADVAFTLHVGRRVFAHRRAILCRSKEEAIEALRDSESGRNLSGRASAKDCPVVFMFPGQGSQYVNMGRDLYRSEPVFRDCINDCARRLHGRLGFDLKDVLYSDQRDRDQAERRLKRTSVTQVALFVVELALARLWISWGVQPSACIGHSIGEYVAACLSGVIKLEDALRLIVLRGRLMDEMPSGVMLAVQGNEEKLSALLGPDLWLSAINGPSLVVVSGTEEAVADLERRLEKDETAYRRLNTSHAFHSGLMDGAVAPFVEEVRKVELAAPVIPYVSNLTGDWADEALVRDPDYWGRQIRRPVLFSQGLRRLLEKPEQVFLEVGPGQTLSTLVRQHQPAGAPPVVSSLRRAKDSTPDGESMFSALSRIWLSGGRVDWSTFYAPQDRRRTPLPGYPLERKRHWIEPARLESGELQRLLRLIGKSDLADWFYLPSWKRAIASNAATIRNAGNARDARCLIFGGADEQTRLVESAFQEKGHAVVLAQPGEAFRADGQRYEIDPGCRDHYRALISELHGRDQLPSVVIHMWGVTRASDGSAEPGFLDDCLQRGFYSLLFLAQALGDIGGASPLRLVVVSSAVYDVIGTETLCPEKATVIGPCRVIPQEYSHISCRYIDVVANSKSGISPQDIRVLAAETLSSAADSLVAIRHGHRWLPVFEPVRYEAAEQGPPGRLREGGVVLITGGLGGIGLALAEYLAEAVNAKLVLTSRSGLPPRERWSDILSGGGADQKLTHQIATVRSLEENGAQVMVARADVCNEDDMWSVVTEAVERFGRIDGVIHAAGVAGGGMIQLKQAQAAGSIMAPKVAGARVLSRVFADVKLDFFVLCSSLASLVGGVGQIDYCAANACLDAYARHFSASTGRFAVAINWNAWREVGMAVETDAPESIKAVIKQQLMANSISTADGVEAFRRILAHEAAPQVAISSQDLQTLIELSNKAESPGEADLVEAAKVALHTELKSRPQLPVPYVAPRTDEEGKICDAWQDMLGIDGIGVHDNFFDLGGHSLLAVALMSRVNKALDSDVPVARLYEGLTIEFLAELIRSGRRTEEQHDEQLERLKERKERAERRKRHQQKRRIVRSE